MIHSVHHLPSRSRELLILKLLSKRRTLTAEEQVRRDSLSQEIDDLSSIGEDIHHHLPDDSIVLYGLNLEFEHMPFHVDCAIIKQDKVQLILLKNYKGEYDFTDNKIESRIQTDPYDSLSQLKEAHMLFTCVLKSMDIHIKVDSSIMFLNGVFTLFDTPTDLQEYLPKQKDTFLSQLALSSGKLTKKHYKLKKQLTSIHQGLTCHIQFPLYVNQARKNGLLCMYCDQVITGEVDAQDYFKCNHCEEKNSTDVALMNTIDEFLLYYPNECLTIERIFDWCNGVVTKQLIETIISEKRVPILS